jgi:hypothetical protein
MKSGISFPVKGLTARALRRIPRFGRSAAMRSISDSRLTSCLKAMIRARSRSSVASVSTSGCSGASTAYVMPNDVSGRVVKIVTNRSVRPAIGRSNSAPSLFPIQFLCMVNTRSGQPGNLSHQARSSSA